MRARVCLLLLLCAVAVAAQAAAQPAQQLETFASLPMRFEPNAGQADPRVRFLARAGAATIFITEDECVAVLTRVHPNAGRERDSDRVERAVIRMRLTGAARTTPAGTDPLPGTSNYFLGNDPAKWRTEIPQFARVEAPDVYNGVDVAYYGSGREFEYDFIVKPGGDPRAIEVQFDGVDRIDIDDSGDLIMNVAGAEIRQRAPVVYQEFRGGRQRITGRYEARSKTSVGFRIGAFDARRPLVIDPTLAYSTYLGGTSTEDPGGIAVDGAGNMYVSGTTQSVDFPTVLAPQPSLASTAYTDMFVVKLNAAGSALLYSTYIGGTNRDFASGIAVDLNGRACVVGSSYSSDFPTTLDAQRNLAGATDAVAVKLAANGGSFVFSTYFGGSAVDLGNAIAVDSSSNVFIAGKTSSPLLPMEQNTPPAGWNGFVARLDSWGGSAMSVFVGGSGSDEARAIATTGRDTVVITGQTSSTDFPVTSNAFRNTMVPPATAFMTEVARNGNIPYSSYIGSGSSDAGNGIAVDPAGYCYVAAEADGGSHLWVAKFTPAWANVYWKGWTGTNIHVPTAIAADAAGCAYVTGHTNSPTLGGNELVSLQNAPRSAFDALVMKCGPTGSLVYAVVIAGNGNEMATGIAVDTQQNVYVTGSTDSVIYPTVSPFKPTLGGPRDIFIAKVTATAEYSAVAGVSAAASSDRVTVSWSPVAGATEYAILRRTGGGNWTEIGRRTAPPYVDTAVQSFTAYAYCIRTHRGVYAMAMSTQDVATVFPATDDPIVAKTTLIRAAHVQEVRQAIDSLRALASLSPYGYSTSVSAGTVIRASDFLQMRAAVAGAYDALGLAQPSFSSLLFGQAVLAAHMNEFRQAVR